MGAAKIRPRGQSLAIVAFGPSSLRYLQVLKSGYQHCLVATQAGGQWHLLDPLSNGMEILSLGDVTPREIVASFRDAGCDVVAVQRKPPVMKTMPLAPFTCVEAVKRVLGIRARSVLTPWQLRRYLDGGRLSSLRRSSRSARDRRLRPGVAQP